jgi:hypothetical protein
MAPLPSTADGGFYFNASGTYTGLYAGNDAQYDLVIPNLGTGVTLYAPTHMPHKDSCVEAVTRHWGGALGQPRMSMVFGITVL